ncbi:MAG: hypothetical protein JXA19_06550 [Anaerolineales bacterium]|nr:hypothetical protein [Anaerolineales bacterium]
MALISILQSMAALSWAAIVAVIIFAVVRSAQGRKLAHAPRIIIVVTVVAILLSIASAGLVFIQPTERGVVISVFGGMRNEALQPGMRWVIPFAENVVTYPVSRQTYTMSIAESEGQRSGDDSIEARTSDGQIVLVDASVIYAVDPAQVLEVHKKWENLYEEKLIRAVSRGIIRDAVSQFGIEEVYSSERVALTDMITEDLQESLNEGGLILVEFVLRNITFSDEYSASIEQKQIAEQLAQQAKFVVEQKKQEAEQARQVAQGQADAAVIAAEGEAQALLINAQAEAEARLVQADAEAQALEQLGEAIQINPDVLTLEYIQKLAPNVEVMMVPSDNPFILQLPSYGGGTSGSYYTP